MSLKINKTEQVVRFCQHKGRSEGAASQHWQEGEAHKA